MANNNSGRDKNEKDLVCSFCGKHQDEVERMIIGPGVNICSECIGLCADLLSDKPDHPGSNSSRPSRGSASRARIQPADDLAINIKTPAEIMIHQPLIGGQGGGLSGQTTDIKIHAEHMVYIRDKMNRMLSEYTGQPLEKIQQDTERDNYLTAQQAKEYGLIDEVIAHR